MNTVTMQPYRLPELLPTNDRLLPPVCGGGVGAGQVGLTSHRGADLSYTSTTPVHTPRDRSPYTPLLEPGRTDVYYQRYLALSNNIAAKYPDQGPPKERHGNAGASWRHIKEVLNNGGNRTLFVDGLVRLYDMDDMRSRIYARNYANRPIVTPEYSAYRRHDDPSRAPSNTHLDVGHPKYRPQTTNPARCMPGTPEKYKGFYTLRQ